MLVNMNNLYCVNSGQLMKGLETSHFFCVKNKDLTLGNLVSISQTFILYRNYKINSAGAIYIYIYFTISIFIWEKNM